MVNRFDVFDRSIGQYDSELVPKASLFAHSVLDVFVHPVSVVWMDPAPHRFAARKALQRIKPPDAGSLLGPIKNFRLVVGRGTGVAYPLCFRQIGFAAAKPVFGLLGSIDVKRQAIPLDDASLSVTQRLT